jgi:hypothetical protein
MDAQTPPEGSSKDIHISRLAITAAVILPVGFLLVLFFIPSSSITATPSVFTSQILVRYAILLLSIIALFTSTALGFISISQIRKSNGLITGLPLAVFVSLFYPIIILDLILIYIGWRFLGTIEGTSLIPLA